MRRAPMLCLIAVVFLAVSVRAPAAVAAGFQGSVHDFSQATGANTQFRDTTGTVTQCNTCHIPHHAGSARPLWNHTLSTVVYSWSEVTTLAGTTLPTAFPSGGTSKACLSCHDGSVAIGSVIQGTSWGTKKISTGLKITGSGNSDLTGNHPVGIPYPDQAGATYNGIMSQAPTAEFKASPSVARIYGSTVGQKGVECGSCHDPHDRTLTDFLRANQSILCTDCHAK